MSRKGEATRQRILDTAQSMILSRGYAGTSLDALIKRLELTKGAFFHHFDSKSDLARHLIERFSDDGVGMFKDHLDRAKRLSDDPLQQLLILVGLYAELFDDLTEPYPGCLLAAYVYEMQLFDDDLKPIINREFELSRREISKLIDQVKRQYPPQADVDSDVLADMFMSTFEGAFVLSKSLNEPDITAQQLRLYRTLIETLFSPRQ